MPHVIAARSELERHGASRIEVRRDSASAFDRELRAALRKTVWHIGRASWYVDAHGNDPNHLPRLWRTHRRRTARKYQPARTNSTQPADYRWRGGMVSAAARTSPGSRPIFAPRSCQSHDPRDRRDTGSGAASQERHKGDTLTSTPWRGRHPLLRACRPTRFRSTETIDTQPSAPRLLGAPRPATTDCAVSPSTEAERRRFERLQRLGSDEEHRSMPRLPLVVDAAAPTSPPGWTTAFIGHASVPSARRISAAADELDPSAGRVDRLLHP